MITKKEKKKVSRGKPMTKALVATKKTRMSKIKAKVKRKVSTKRKTEVVNDYSLLDNPLLEDLDGTFGDSPSWMVHYDNYIQGRASTYDYVKDKLPMINGAYKNVIQSYQNWSVNGVANKSGRRFIKNSLYSREFNIGTSTDVLTNIIANQKFMYGQFARNLYRNMPLLGNIIDLRVQNALREGFIIKTYDESIDEDKLNQAFEKRFRELDLDRIFNNILTYSNIYSRGVMILPLIEEEGETSTNEHLGLPLDLSRVKRLKAINIVHDGDFFYFYAYHSPISPHYTKPVISLVDQVIMHNSRSLVVVQNLDPFISLGVSTIDKVIDDVRGINIASWGVSSALLKFQMLILKTPHGDGSDITEVKARSLLSRLKSTFTSQNIVRIPKEWDFDYINAQFTQVKQATDFLWEKIASTSNNPQSALKGQAQGSISSGHRDLQHVYERVKADEQMAKLKPSLDFLIPIIANEKSGPIYEFFNENKIDPASFEFYIEFNSLHTLTELEKADLELKKSQAELQEFGTEFDPSNEFDYRNHPKIAELVKDNPEYIGL